MRSSFGGVFTELAEWLADGVRSAGADVAVLLPDDPAPGAEVVLLLGAGPEFDPCLEWPGRRRLLLWAFDPLPPPGAAGDLRRGRRLNWMRRIDALLPLAGRPGDLHLRRRLVRSAALRLGRASDGFDAFAEARLAWFLDVAPGAIDEYWVSSPASVATLAQHGIRARYQPVAVHPAMGADLALPRDIDVLFLGSRLGGRELDLRRIEARLEAEGVALTVVDRACYGATRTELLNRTRVTLNLHKFPWHLERIRLVLAAMNGAAVASALPVLDPAPLVVGRDLVAADPRELADVVLDLLGDEQRRARMARSAADAVAEMETVDDVAQRLLAGAP